MVRYDYVMEDEAEALRLELKTDSATIRKNAIWAGIQAGMDVADLGCGPGKTTYLLNELVQPGGSAVGVDISASRIKHAQSHYQADRLKFVHGDIRKPLKDLGSFDFAWVRFVLEHYRHNSFDIVQNVTRMVKPGGILCLIDLDYNCLTHYGISANLERALFGIMGKLEKEANFDPYVGRKLYAYLYDLGYSDIDVQVAPHHLIFGQLSTKDHYNWGKKIEIAAKNSGFDFDIFEGGFAGFQKEFSQFFSDPRRFTYTPVIIVRGRKATEGIS